MGEIDINVKNFIKLNSVFAQLFSKWVYKGDVFIEPNKLQELDTANQESLKLEDGQLKSLERLRDAQRICMIFNEKIAFQIIMGIEGQTGVHYYMPVRCMELDALSYSLQCKKISQKAKEDKRLQKYADGVPKGTKIVPTVTLVFYYGDTPWDGPLSVYDMLDIPEDMKIWAKDTIPDYQMNIIDVKHITDHEIEMFDGDLKAFLLMIRDSYDREKLKTVIATHRETWYAIGTIKKDKRYIDYINQISDADIEGGMYMDATLDRLIAEESKKAEVRGEAKGEARGEKRGKACVNELGARMEKAGRTADFMKSLTDEELQRKLFIEFKIDAADH